MAKSAAAVRRFSDRLQDPKGVETGTGGAPSREGHDKVGSSLGASLLFHPAAADQAAEPVPALVLDRCIARHRQKQIIGSGNQEISREKLAGFRRRAYFALS